MRNFIIKYQLHIIGNYLNIVLDELILLIYNNIKHINPLFLILLSLLLTQFNYLFLSYISYISFICGIFVSIIFILKYWITNGYCKSNYPKLYRIIRLLLLLSLIITISIFIYYIIMIICHIIYNLTYSLCKFLYSKFWTKSIKEGSTLKFKDSEGYPNTSSSSFHYSKKKVDIDMSKYNLNSFFSYKKKKKVHKDITEKARELKEEVLGTQNKDWKDNTADSNKSISGNREWEHKIHIQERTNLSDLEQLNKLDYEYKAYNNQDKKFKKIISDIKKNKEKFYPKESISLFEDYIEVIKNLKANLKSMKKGLKKKK